jgi:hypothetical protein
MQLYLRHNCTTTSTLNAVVCQKNPGKWVYNKFNKFIKFFKRLEKPIMKKNSKFTIILMRLGPSNSSIRSI